MKHRHKETAKSTSLNKKKFVWKKVLYENQGVPDNYVDSTFLNNLRKNESWQTYTLPQCVLAASKVTQEICLTFMFIVVFIYLSSNRTSPMTILSIISAISIIAFSILAFIRLCNLSDYLGQLKDGAVFLLFAFGFSPLLKTLTETISTDTIYAMVTIMLLCHLLFQDYGAHAAIVSGTLSLNASFFAAVCLASRLPTTMHAFTLLTISVEIFALSPFLHKHLHKFSMKTQTSATFVIVVSAIFLMSTISLISTLLLVLLLIFVNFWCPVLFLHCQKYKTNIYGPWDEAIVNET